MYSVIFFEKKIIMKINNFLLSPNSSIYLIAEISANHNGSINGAKQAISEAKKCGANAVKIQTYTPDTLTIKCDNPEFILKGGLWDGRTLYDLYKEAHTPYEWHRELFDHAKKEKITLFSTPFDETAVDLLESLNTPAYKIASFELIDIPLIKRVASRKKPILMSTGAASLDEISEALSVARKAGAEEILLFHCISSYPAPIEESNLNHIKYLQKKFGVLVGLSDHSIGSDVSFIAAGLGVSAIEKHFTVSKKISGPDTEFSATPVEFKELRKKIDAAKTILGSKNFLRSKSEKQSSKIRKSIYFIKSKDKGETISKKDIKVIRPGLGLHPRYFDLLNGKKLIKKTNYGDPVTWNHLETSLRNNDKRADDFKLIKIKPTTSQIKILYNLLNNRSKNISHKKMPSYSSHSKFVKNNPYRAWWILQDSNNENNILGLAYINYDNSVGLHINFSGISFSASYFINKVKKNLKTLKAQKSKIFKDYYFNVSPKNVELIDWLAESGYKENQRSFSL
jgi:pseudaminic acid synthase